MHYIFRFYQVELDIPLEEQGPFDLIIQKVPDYLGKAVGKELGKDEALQMLQGIKVSKGWSVRKVMGGERKCGISKPVSFLMVHP